MAQGLHHSSLQLPISLVSFCQLKTKTKIPRWQQKEEAENMLPKVNSWRDAGDTPGRKNHQEQAKLQTTGKEKARK
jgi:hypothetical protein